jgi:soluble lytic murein transglycosylase-like protein
VCSVVIGKLRQDETRNRAKTEETATTLEKWCVKVGKQPASVTLALALLMVAVGAAGQVGFASLAQRAPAPPTRNVRLLDLTGVRRLFDTLAREWSSMNDGEQAAAWTEFSLLTEAVIGNSTGEALTFGDLQGTVATGGPVVVASAGVMNRDGAAYQLQGLGYSARETADVVSGRISLAALDNAFKMLLVGRGKEAAANYLDSQYRRVAAWRSAPALPAGRALDPIDAAIERYAALYRVDPVIVRAIIGVESAYDAGARSRAGAVGLMQLMPGTARALGVDPFIPEQNIAGGVRYLSALLEMFGGLELALVAYNGGPGFARRYAQGQIALYGETREYVRRVLSRIPGINRRR